MKNTRTLALAVAVSVSAGGWLSSSAYAGGFLADTFVRPFSPQAADTLDRAHAAAGRPLDHAANAAAGAAANYVVPGSGVYVTQGLELRDAYNRGAVR
jgi:hypothetical protein